MSDEGGGGSWVAAAIKQLDNPDAAEVAKIERLVDETVVGNLQVADGPKAGAVKKSLFYYDPAKFPGAYDAFPADRSEEHPSELQSLMRISYAVFCLKQK